MGKQPAGVHVFLNESAAGGITSDISDVGEREQTALRSTVRKLVTRASHRDGKVAERERKMDERMATQWPILRTASTRWIWPDSVLPWETLCSSPTGSCWQLL